MSLDNFTMYIDDIDINWYDMRLVGYEIQSYTDRKVTGIDIPGAHGIQSVPSTLKPNEFFATVIFSGDDSEDVNTKIRQFFAFMYSTSSAHKIVFSDDASIVRYAILDASDKYKVIRGIDGALAEIKLSFLMQNPFMYQNLKDKIVRKASHAQELYVSNEAFECPAIFSLTNTGTEIVTDIGLIVNGELASFSCQLNPGDTLILDTVEYEVRYNNEVRLDYWDGEMPMLKNGNNVIYQQNTQHAELMISIEFTKQWV